MLIGTARQPMPGASVSIESEAEPKGKALPQPPLAVGPRPGEQQVIWVLWLTYGSFYFCRTNLSAAVPGMEAPLAQGGLALSRGEIGWILAALKVSYGVGQLFNGQLAEHIGPRRLLVIGMLCSAGLNVLFGFSTGFYFLLFVWATNGYFQSLGWTPCIRVVSNWVPVTRRGAAIGIIGTGYQVTLGLTYFVAGQAAQQLGWRGALWVPAVILASAAVFMLVFLRERPAEPSGASPSEGDGQQPFPGADQDGKAHLQQTESGPADGWAEGSRPPSRAGHVLENTRLTLSNPALWLLGFALGLLNACRYGFVDWGITHLHDVQKAGVGKAALTYVVLAAGAVMGSYLAGWATDRFFGSRRGPVIFLLLVLLGLVTLAYEAVAHISAVATVVLLVVIGFCIYGPQVLLVGTAPADLARRGTAAAAAGFVNFLGYMGAAMGDRVTGHYSMPEHGGWRVAIYIWAGWAFAAALAAGLLWNKTARKEA